jgi:hypothetical protein
LGERNGRPPWARAGRDEATLIAPEVGLRLAQILLALGVASGLFAVVHYGKANTQATPALKRISPHGWLSLVFLGLAGVVVGLQAVYLLNPAGRPLPAPWAAGVGQQGAGAKPGQDDLLVDWWRKRDSPGPVDVSNPEAVRAGLEQQVRDLRKEVLELRTALQRSTSENSGRPAVSSISLPANEVKPEPRAGSLPAIDLSRWHH